MADGGRTPHRMDRREHLAMGTAHLRQGLGHMLEQVKPVRDLDRLGGALARAVRIGRSTARGSCSRLQDAP